MAAVAMGSLDTKSEVMRMTQESNLQDSGKKNGVHITVRAYLCYRWS